MTHESSQAHVGVECYRINDGQTKKDNLQLRECKKLKRNISSARTSRTLYLNSNKKQKVKSFHIKEARGKIVNCSCNTACI